MTFFWFSHIQVGGTDTKHYLHLCDAIYRFQPVRLTKSGISMFHGTDEKISVNNFNQVLKHFQTIAFLVNHIRYSWSYNHYYENMIFL